MLIADRFHYFLLHGERLKWRNALIRSYGIQEALNEDDE
jgi:hypothetical protein